MEQSEKISQRTQSLRCKLRFSRRGKGHYVLGRDQDCREGEMLQFACIYLWPLCSLSKMVISCLHMFSKLNLALQITLIHLRETNQHIIPQVHCLHPVLSFIESGNSPPFKGQSLRCALCPVPSSQFRSLTTPSMVNHRLSRRHLTSAVPLLCIHISPSECQSFFYCLVFTL